MNPRTSQLDWIYRNRQPRSRTGRVGVLSRELMKPDFDAKARHRGEVLRAVAEIADDVFRDSCTLGPTDHRSVTILVEHPALLYGLRLTWCMALVEHLDRRCRFHVTPKVRFRLGKSPDRFLTHEQLAD